MILDVSVGFSKDLGQCFYWTVLVFRILDGWMLDFSCGFPGSLDVYINQLLTQSYTGVTACTIAILPYFKLMVNTAAIVKRRTCIK